MKKLIFEKPDRFYVVSRLAVLFSAVLYILLDQWTKMLAVTYLKGQSPFVVIPNFLRFSYVENRGAAFGSFADSRWVFMVISSVAILAISFYILYERKLSRLALMSLTFILAGGIGNMIDRVALGYVVDFIDVYGIHFAVFNVADSFVTVGCFLLIAVLIFEMIRESKQKKPK